MSNAGRDLQDHLYGDGGLTDRLGKYIAGELPPPHNDPSGEHVVNVRFAAATENGVRPLKDIPVKKLVSAQAIAEEVHKAIADIYGWSPDGNLEIRVNKPGEAARPPIRLNRRCVSAESAAEEPSLALVRAQLAAERQARQEMHAQTVALVGHLTAVVSSQNATIGTLATARGAAAAAGDISGPWGIVALGALILGYPSVKAALKLPADADIGAVIARIQSVMIGVVERQPKRLDQSFDSEDWAPPSPPLPPSDRPPEPGTAAPAGDAVTPPAPDVPNLETLSPELTKWFVETLERLKREPAARDALIARAVGAGFSLERLAALQT
jgi:hypothetical protein